MELQLRVRLRATAWQTKTNAIVSINRRPNIDPHFTKAYSEDSQKRDFYFLSLSDADTRTSKNNPKP